MENAFGTEMRPTRPNEDPDPPTNRRGPQWVYVDINGEPQKEPYRLYSPSQEHSIRTQLGLLWGTGFSISFLSYMRVQTARTQVQRAQHLARLWERRCMNLQGRERAPYVPSAFHKIWYGERGQFWAEDFGSPWQKTIEEKAKDVKVEHSKYDLALLRYVKKWNGAVYALGWPIRRFERYLHPPKVHKGHHGTSVASATESTRAPDVVSPKSAGSPPAISGSDTRPCVALPSSVPD